MISFHFSLSALTIGMAGYLAVWEAMWLKTTRRVYVELCHYWLKVYTAALGKGVVSGLVKAY